MAYEKTVENDPPGALRVQFGKVNEDYHGGFWLPLAFPTNASFDGCDGFGFTFTGDGTVPQNCILTLKSKDGTTYRSRELRELFMQTAWGEVTLGAKDFTLDPEYVKRNPEKA